MIHTLRYTFRFSDYNPLLLQSRCCVLRVKHDNKQDDYGRRVVESWALLHTQVRGCIYAEHVQVEYGNPGACLFRAESHLISYACMHGESAAKSISKSK